MFLFRSDMDPEKDFADELAEFLARTRMSPTAFGRRALGDPNFILEFRRGRAPTLRTLARARAFMARETVRLARAAGAQK